MNRNKYKERLGEIRENNFGTKMKIVEYNNADDIWVEFQDEYKVKVHTSYSNFKRGVCKNPYDKKIFNTGYIGVGKYSHETTPEIYTCWHSMIRRCYSEYTHKIRPTYKNMNVCKEWHCLQNFGKWYEENYYEINNEKMHLDKDILIKGNKIYSPNTCIFVPQTINDIFVTTKKNRGEYPIGCTEFKGEIQVQCWTLEGKKIHLGKLPLNRPFQAFTIYKNFKENYIKQVAEEYKNLIPKNLYNAMYSYEVEIND